jgi:hypothetical protein
MTIHVREDITVDVQNRRRYGEFLRAGTIVAAAPVVEAQAVRQAVARALEDPTRKPAAP